MSRVRRDSDQSVCATLPSARGRQERRPARALRTSQASMGARTRSGQGEKETRSRQKEGQRTCYLVGAQRLTWSAATRLEINTARLEASPAPHPSPAVFVGAELSGQPGGPTLISVGAAFPAVPTRAHPVVRVWGSPRQLTCADPAGRGQWGRQAGSQGRGGRASEPLCGMGGAPAPQGWGEGGKGLPRLLSPRGSMLADDLLRGPAERPASSSPGPPR